MISTSVEKDNCGRQNSATCEDSEDCFGIIIFVVFIYKSVFRVEFAHLFCLCFVCVFVVVLLLY